MQLNTTVLKTLDHEHLCTIYETPGQQLALAVPFLKAGLDRGEKCLYVGDESSAETILRVLEAEGLHLSRHLQDGSFEVLGKEDTFLRKGSFYPDGMVSFLSGKADQALSEGRSGLRVLGEMTWILNANITVDRLTEFESKLNRLITSKPVTLICQYNRTLFSSEVMVAVIKTHPLVVYEDRVSKNPYYVPPEEFLAPEQAPRKLSRLLENIHNWNRNEEELSAIARRFRTAFQSAPLGIVILSAAGRILDENPAYCRLLDYSSQELRNMSIEDLTHPEDWPRYSDLLRKLVTGEIPAFVCEKRYVTKSGTILWDEQTVSTAALPYGESEPPSVIAMVQDITVRKRNDLERNRLASVVEKASDFIGVCDLNVNVLFVNTAGRKLVGLSSLEEALKTRVTDYFFPEDADYIVKEVFPVVLERRTWSGELRFRHFQTGEAIPVAFYDIFTIDDPQTGKPVNIATVTRDIRDQKRAQHQLQRSYDELRAVSARLETVREDERRRVAREIHDELGQALTAIKIELSSFLDNLPPNNHNPSKAESIVGLVNQTIDSVRRISTELRPRILDDLGIVAALEWMSDDFEMRTGMEVHTDLPEDVALDPERATALFRIAQEALTNVARHANARHVSLTLLENGNELALQIRDDGVGFAEASGGRTGSIGILGMKERAALIGGQLDIASGSGAGTTVSVRIAIVPRAGGYPC